MARRPRERIDMTSLAWGEFLAASPVVQEMAGEANAELGSGLSEDEVRQRIRSRCESEGISGLKATLPSLNRKLMRMKLNKLLHMLVDYWTGNSQHKRVGDLSRSLLDKVGWDQWLEDYIYEFAVTGEPGSMYELFTGKTFVQELGRPDEKVPTVWAVLTPASDVKAILAEAEELTRQHFYHRRIADAHRPEFGARAYRLYAETGTDMTFAHELAERERPDLHPDGDEIVDVARSFRGRVKKARRRFEKTGDENLRAMYPDSD